MVTKQQIVNGLIAYIRQHIVPSTSDGLTKRMMAGVADVLQMKPHLIDKLSILQYLEDENGMYDLDVLEQLLVKNINEYGNIPVTLLGGTYTFNESDVIVLKRTILC